MEIREQLANMLRRTDGAVLSLVDGLSEAERQSRGSLTKWSVKDIIAHISTWCQDFAVRMQGQSTEQRTDTLEELDELNAEIFARNRDKSWETVLAEYRQAMDSMGDHLQAMTEEELLDTERYAWQNQRPLWMSVVGSVFTHPMMHLAQILVEKGNTARATQLQDEAAEQLLKLDDSPAWRGVVVYNLACYLAIAGQTAQAISRLAEAFRDRPDLIAYSREDPDLASLQQLPEYEELCAQ
jgi:hypothetical protein